jgi:thiosulfate dehydrogenase [quinone] large subunit
MSQRASRHRQKSLPPILAGWATQSWAERLLRAFLGVTFLYAGVQKLTDPNFFSMNPQASTSIHYQLEIFARNTPLGPLMSLLAHMSTLTGYGIALLEIAIGLGTLLGIGIVAAAVAGFLVNLTLTLTASWHTHPYFIGSDSIYAIAWLALVFEHLEWQKRQVRLAAVAAKKGGKAQAAVPVATPGDYGRREFIRGGAVAALTFFIAGMSKAVAGKPTVTAASSFGGAGGSGGSGSSGGSSGATAATGPPATGGGSGTPIAKLDSIPVGGAIPFNDQSANVPAALIRLGQDNVVAYSRICTHMGCEVGWDQQAKLLVCPCHGAEYDPANGAQPVAGPTSIPLQSIKVEISNGEVILPA